MKRKLDKKEIELNKRAKHRILLDLGYAKEYLGYNLAAMEFNNKWKSVIESKKSRAEKKSLKLMKDEVDFLQAKVDIIIEQLNDGVETKGR